MELAFLNELKKMTKKKENYKISDIEKNIRKLLV
jgi:hypothetical protein